MTDRDSRRQASCPALAMLLGADSRRVLGVEAKKRVMRHFREVRESCRTTRPLWLPQGAGGYGWR